MKKQSVRGASSRSSANTKGSRRAAASARWRSRTASGAATGSGKAAAGAERLGELPDGGSKVQKSASRGKSSRGGGAGRTKAVMADVSAQSLGREAGTLQ